MLILLMQSRGLRLKRSEFFEVADLGIEPASNVCGRNGFMVESNRVPTMFQNASAVAAGGLMSYSSNWTVIR